MKACEDKIAFDEAVIPKFSAKRLALELDSHIWKNIKEDYIEAKTLWKDFTSYLYFPRLLNYTALEGAILEALHARAYFAIADTLQKTAMSTCAGARTKALLARRRF